VAGIMSVRLVDIARKTGYSVSTVSRALHSSSSTNKISDAAIAKIRAVADELGYKTNILARSLKSQKTYEIGVAVSDILNPFFATLIKSISEEVRNIGYTLMLCDSDENANIEKESLRHLLEKRVDGLIIAPVGTYSEYFQEIYKSNIPTILVDRIFQNSLFDTVSVDNYKGSCLATEHLIKEGHNKIAFIQGFPGAVTNEQRLMGYKETLEEYQIPVSAKYIVGDDFRSLNGYLQTKSLLKYKNPPTAIFTAGDLIALGCIEAINEENLKIPQDISLVSFDDPKFFAHLSPPITAVRQPVTKMGIIAVKLLLDRINNNNAEKKQIQLNPELIIRNSVRRISDITVSEETKTIVNEML
jgi:LacI family transcriptional regulator